MGMDSYVRAFVRVNVHIDAGQRVWCKGEELTVVVPAKGPKKVLLPISKILYTFDQLKRAGAKCDVVTLSSLAKAGAEGRWREEIAERKREGVPSNVYVANARSVNLALAQGKDPPPVKWVGRMRDKITDVYDTIDEVVLAMSEDRWRTTFSRGRYAKKA